MIGIELLNNTGIQFIGDKTSLNKEEKTFIVMGIARGGTSLIAGTLHHLGIFTGDKSTAPVFEDITLSNAFEGKNSLKEAKKIILNYNNRYKVWGFKRPSSIHYIHQLHKMCKNPIYLFIFKDIFSISNRNNISMKSDILSGLQKAHSDYAEILSFIMKNDFNGFLFSYEKIMKNQENFIDTLIDIIGKDNVTQEQKDAALNFIEPNPQDYLNASRITRSIGRIGSMEKKQIIGWGKYIYSNEPAQVDLYINDNYIESVIAKDFRPHILKNKTHPTGHCGYIFNLKKALKDGDKVSVKLSDDVQFLNNSNQIFKEKK